MKKLIIAALASAFAVFGSWADTPNWFDGGITADWPEAEGMNGAWSATTGYAVTDLATKQLSDEVYQLELDAGDATLSFTATNSKNLSEGTDSVTYTTSVKFYPYSAVPASVDADAKAGVIAVNETVDNDTYTYLYVLAKKDGASENEWVKVMDGEDPVVIDDLDLFYTIKVTISKKDANLLTVAYNVELQAQEITYTKDVYTANFTTSQACYSGSGYIQTLEANAVTATKTFKIDVTDKNMTVDTVVANGQTLTPDDDGYYTVEYDNAVVITFAAAQGYAFKDGNSYTKPYADITSGGTISEFGSVETEAGKAHIGTTYYLSLNAAIEAAVTMESSVDSPVTVVLDADNLEAAGFSIAANTSGTDKAIVIDFNSKTYTFTSGNAQDATLPIALNPGWQIALKDGTLKVSSDFAATATGFIFDAASKLTLNGTTLDASNFAVASSVAVKHLNGDVDVTGDAAITAPSSVAFYAFAAGDDTLTKEYSEGTITLNTTGTIAGDWVLFGSAIAKTAATIPDGTKFYHATAAKSNFAITDVKIHTADSGFGFKAISGTVLAIPDPTPVEKTLTVGGRLYTSFADAFADEAYAPTATATSIIDLDEDVEVPANKTLVMGQFDVNGKQIKLNSGSIVTSQAEIAPGSFKDVPAGQEVKGTESSGVYSYQLGAKEYTITVDANGGEGGSASRSSYTMSDAAIEVALTQPTAATGKAFKEWTTTLGSISGDTLTIPANSAKDVTVTATWSNCVYKITIVDPGSATADPDTYTIEETEPGYIDIELTAEPTKDGYTFKNYSLTEKAGVSLSGNTITIKQNTIGDIEVTAEWEKVASGTTFTVTTTGCSVSVKIDDTVKESSPYVAQVGETISFTLSPSTTMEIPSYSGTFGNQTLNNTSFTNGVYSYTVTDQSATEISCQFTMIDAKSSSDVKPIDVVPADTDPENVATAAQKIDALATKSGESKADVTLTQNVATWINAKSIKGDDIAAAEADDLEAAYLLNCGDLMEATIETAKAAFKFSSITPGAKPTVTTPDGYHGTLTTWGNPGLDADDWVDLKDKSDMSPYKFYKAELTK